MTRTVKLEDLADIIAGQHIDAALYSSKPVGVPYLTGPADFGDRYPSVTKWTSSPKVYARKGDVLVTVKGAGVGKSNMGEDAAIGRQLMALRPKDGQLDQSYLFHFVRHMEVEIARRAAGATVPGVVKDDLATLPLPQSSLVEQRRIAAILDKADALRQKRKGAIALLDGLTQSIFQEMFEPREWPESTLGEITGEFRYGASEKSGAGGFPTLRIPNVARGEISLQDLKTVDVPPKEFERLRLRVGDLLFVRTNGNREYVGRSAVVDEELSRSSGLPVSDFIFASYLIRARLEERLALPHFVQAHLSSSSGRKSLLERCKTSAGQFNINTESLATIPVPLPDIQLQRRFVERTSVLRSRKDAWAISQVQLDGLATSLRQRAFDVDGLGT